MTLYYLYFFILLKFSFGLKQKYFFYIFQPMQVEEAFSTDCIKVVNDNMFDPSLQQQSQLHNDQQQLHATQQHDPSEKSSLAEFPFCYSTNLLHKGQIQQNANIENEKSPYRYEVGQTFNCNYAIVNQMSLASTTTYKCDVCGLVFASLSLLNHHKKIHSNSSIALADRIFACDVCGTTFTQLCEMKAHLQTAHTTNKCCSIHVDCDHGNNKLSKFTETCNFDSQNSNAYRSHHNQRHTLMRDVCIGTDDSLLEPGIKKSQTKKKPLATITKCTKCNGSGIIVIGNIQNVNEKPYHCNICGSTFSRYSSLWSHKRLHSGEKPFKCNLCGSTFARASSLKNHNRVHTGERPYKCDVCGMQFSQAHHLKSHERIHSGERPYECEVCGKTFARHSTLWNHRRIHTGEKPYRCDICGSAFHQATHLKNHSKVHTGEKPHRCDICDVGFSDRFALKRHRAIHEKYGQTSRVQPGRPPSSVNSENSWKHSQSGTSSQNSEQMDSHLYKCDSSHLNNQSQQNSSQIEEIYNSDSITFPGCSRSSDK